MHVAVGLPPADGFDRPVADAVLGNKRGGRPRVATNAANLCGCERPWFPTTVVPCTTAILGVGPVRPGVQMLGVDAGPVVAGVADDGALRDWTDELLIDGPMGVAPPPFHSHLPVPTDETPGPQQALGHRPEVTS